MKPAVATEHHYTFENGVLVSHAKTIAHHMPAKDVRPHVESSRCWCRPEINDCGNGRGFIVHFRFGEPRVARS